MVQNNSINTGPIASLAESIAGSDTTKLITPYTAYRTLLARGLNASKQNLGITTSGGLMTITAADQTALSTTNLGTVIIPSKTMGEFNTFYITSNQVLTISNMTNNLFGTTVGVAWANNLRLYIYAVSNDAEDTVTFAVSRIRSRVTAPSAANIGTPSSAVADTQGSFFMFSSVTVADYESNPCVCIGSFLVTKNSSDVWSQVAVARDTGINRFGNGFLQSFPAGQFGAVSTKVTLANGGVGATFSTQLIQYMLQPNGLCTMFVNLNTVTVASSGSVNTQVTIPFAPAYDNYPLVAGDIFIAGASTGYYPIIHSANYMEFKRTSTGAFLLNSTATANMAFVLTYQVSDQ
jgi:hypothetical protein